MSVTIECCRCLAVVPGEDTMLTPIDHTLPNIPAIGHLCMDCWGELCSCEQAFMEQDRPEWKWVCPSCGTTCPPDLMLFFKGRAVAVLSENAKP